MNLAKYSHAAGLVVGIAGAAFGIPQDTQSPKQDMKDAGQNTKKAAKQTGEIGDREFAAAAMDELDSLPALQINARNQHGRRTSMPLSRR